MQLNTCTHSPRGLSRPTRRFTSLPAHRLEPADPPYFENSQLQPYQYVVKAVPSGGINYLFADTVIETATGTSYCLRGLKSNVIYWVKVAAVNQYGQGDFSQCSSYFSDCSVSLTSFPQSCGICSNIPPPPSEKAPSPPYNVRAPVYGQGTTSSPYVSTQTFPHIVNVVTSNLT